MIKSTALAALALCLASLLTAQPLPVPRNIQATYDKGVRDTSGAPGPNYWQNTADYDIRVRFDPASLLISGTENIVYTNNSPDTLRSILFKLYPNLYKKGAPRLSTVEPEDITDGVKISRLAVDGENQPTGGLNIRGTEMMLRVTPLAPGNSIRFEVDYAYALNKNSHNRTGAVDGGAAFIAYFFPRIAVYDDIDGWNRNPYLGTQEFYNDFCDFKLAVTVPKDYLVWATGDLLNCSEVLSAKYCERLALAEKQDPIRFVIDSLDLKQGGITTQKPENTFRFEALNVVDVAFAVSNHYLWHSGSVVADKTTGRRTRVDAVFNSVHHDYFLVAEDARKTVEAMSFEFPKWPFPYNHMTVFDGLDQMEYPMMANDNPVEDRAESIELTVHEIFHTFSPFYMGANETKYGWMDEGWATIGEWLISPMIDPSIVNEYGMPQYQAIAGTEADLPVMTPTTQQSGATMFVNSYPKPALGFLFARDLLGDEAFFKGLHQYIRNWNGKHPIPYDFFNSMNTGSGVNLNWFWKRWFFDDGFPDLAIASVKDLGGNLTSILVESKGTKPVPVDLTIVFEDRTESRLHRSVAVWEKGGESVEIQVRTPKKIREVRLGSTYVPDVNLGDNVYPGR